MANRAKVYAVNSKLPKTEVLPMKPSKTLKGTKSAVNVLRAQHKLRYAVQGDRKISTVSSKHVAAAMSKDFRKVMFSQSSFMQGQYMIHPQSSRLMLWDAMMAVVVCIIMFEVPLHMAMDWWEPDIYYTLFMKFSEIVSCIDIVLHFRTAIMMSNGKVDSNPVHVMKHYAKTWLIIDLVGVIPFDTLFSSFSGTHRKSIKVLKYVRLPKLFRVVKLLRVIRKHATYYGMMLTMAAFLFTLHMMSCMLLWTILDCTYTPNVCTSKYAWVLYIHVIRNTLDTLTMSDHLSSWRNNEYFTVIPGSRVESGVLVITIFGSFIGLFLVASVFTSVANVLDTMNDEGLRYQMKMAKFNKELEHFHISPDIREHVNMHYEYLWMKRKNYQSMSVLKDQDVSLSIRRKISTFLFQDLVERVHFIKDVNSNRFVSTVCMNLTLQVYMPGDYCCYAGDPSRHFYIINEGSLCVLKDSEEPENLSVLSKGNYFGEIGLIEERCRTNSVLSLTTSEVCLLEKSVFDALRAEYPVFDETISLVSKTRLSNTVKRQMLSLAKSARIKLRQDGIPNPSVPV